MESTDPDARRRRRLRRLVAIAAGLAAALIGAVAALPWALGTPPARRWLLTRASRGLAPGAIEAETLWFSWLGPIEASGLVLLDHQGEAMVRAPRATLDRGLLAVLFDRPRLGTLTLRGASVDLDRRPDGSIDLLETLRPILGRDPRTDLAVRIEGGPLRVRALGVLAEPFEAGSADVLLRIEPAPGPLSWRLEASNGEAESLEVVGRLDRWKGGPDAAHDLAIDVKARDWPLALDTSGVEARMRLGGGLAVARREALWAASGSVEALGLDATAPALAGDRLRLDRLVATSEIAQEAGSWVVRRLDLRSPIATLYATGALPAPIGSESLLEGRVDLAALADQLPHALRLREGSSLERGAATLRVVGRAEEGRETWRLDAEVVDLAVRSGDRVVGLDDPANLRAEVALEAGAARLEGLGLTTAFLDASARGDLREGLTLEGTIDLEALPGLLAQFLDLGGLELAGHGSLSGSYRAEGNGYRTELAADLIDVRLAGLGPVDLDLEALRLEGLLGGSASGSGVPDDWSGARLGLTSGDASAELALNSREEGTGLVATIDLPLALGDLPGRVNARASAHWDEGVVLINQARLAVVPADDPDALFPGVDLSGRLDRASGELSLRSADDPPPGLARAVALELRALQASGLGGSEALQVDVDLGGNLESLGRFLGLSDDLAGTWTGHLLARGVEGDDLDLGGRIDLADLSWPASDGDGRQAAGPLGLAWRAAYRSEADRVDLPEIVLAGRYATLEASGLVDDPGGLRRFELLGRLSPDWASINDLLAERVGTGVQLAGEPRPFRLAGSLGDGEGGTIWERIEAEVGVDLVEADLFGMVVGPTPVVARAQAGRLLLDPIETTLNGGSIRLEPEIDLADEQGATLRLGPGSGIRDAEINAEVSRRVLAFVAPILQEATRVTGAVSVDVDRASFPIGGRDDRGVNVEGAVLFRDVEFTPGGLGQDLVALVGLTDVAHLRLDQPVVLEIADGRVIQHGLAVPIGRLTQVELSGEVDFDRNLRLVAEVPLTRSLAGNLPILADVVEGTRISVPIRGTLSKPQIDREAFADAMKGLGVDLIERSALRGAAGLLDLLGRARERRQERRRDREP